MWSAQHVPEKLSFVSLLFTLHFCFPVLLILLNFLLFPAVEVIRILFGRRRYDMMQDSEGSTTPPSSLLAI